MNPQTAKIRNREKAIKALKDKRIKDAEISIDKTLQMNGLSAGVVLDKKLLMQLLPMVFESGKITIKYTLWETN